MKKIMMKPQIPEAKPPRRWPRALIRQAAGLLSSLALAALAMPSLSAYTVPNTADLLFQVNTDSLPVSGNTGNWAAIVPASGIFNIIGTPTVDNVGTTPVKWEKNVANGTGYYSNWPPNSPQQVIAVNGVSAIAAVKPVSGHSNDRNWTPIIDILFGAFRLGVRNDTRVVILTVSTAVGGQTQYNSTYTIQSRIGKTEPGA